MEKHFLTRSATLSVTELQPQLLHGAIVNRTLTRHGELSFSTFFVSS